MNKNSLRGVIGRGTLAIAGLASLAGCSAHEDYNFNDMLGKEHVKFSSRYGGEGKNDVRTSLTVKREDGSEIIYKDYEDNDFNLESVEIIKDGKSTTYFDDKIGRDVLKVAQEQFDDFLKSIIEEKRRRGREAIKKGLEDISKPGAK